MVIHKIKDNLNSVDCHEISLHSISRNDTLKRHCEEVRSADEAIHPITTRHCERRRGNPCHYERSEAIHR